MIWLPVTFASAIIFGTGGFLLKLGNHKSYPVETMLLGLYLAGSFVFLLGTLHHGAMKLTLPLIGFSFLVGLGSYYGNTFLVRAYESGPAVLTSPLMSMNILLVVILSVFFYGEKLTGFQSLGITCMVIAIALLSSQKNSHLIKSRAWGFFVAVAILFIFMREGGLKVSHEAGLNNYAVLFLAYVFSTFLALGKFFLNRQEKISSKHSSAFLFGELIGVCSAVGMDLLAYAIAYGPASIVVPLFSMRNFVAVLLLVIFFKKKLHRLQWAAIGLMLAGITLIS
jgi:drug/metabolite transporter (DMT)-like permease